MNTRKETFNKSERLCSKKTITALFENGNIFYSAFFKIVWQVNPASLPFPAEVAFSISKKGFRLSVTRNLIRRRMREAYRRNKQILYDFLDSENTRISFIIIFRDVSVPDYVTIEKSMKEMLTEFISAIKKNKKKC
ncbi:MAG: ribonuclease P protein component [Bacteroidales bacterium]|nr:ribonuclease P protein component [Bacteroidales bacterium]